MPIKLIALDMDGTTLNKEQVISAGNLSAIDKALFLGLTVAVCTGRENTELVPILKMLPKVRYFISGNGCQIYDRKEDKIIFSQPIKRDIAQKLYLILSEFPVMTEVYSGKKIFTSRTYYEEARQYAPKQFWDFIQKSRTPLDDLSTLFAPEAEPIFKINVFYRHDSDAHYHIRRRCQELALSITSSCDRNIEFSALNISKGTAIKKLCTLLDIPFSEVLAIGDGSNDISMLRLAGTSVAMANASDAVQQAARFVTRSNDEDGVAIALYRFLPIDADL